MTRTVPPSVDEGGNVRQAAVDDRASAAPRTAVVVATGDVGGAETQALMLARHLRDEHRHDVLVVAFARGARLSSLCAESGVPFEVISWPQWRGNRLVYLAQSFAAFLAFVAFLRRRRVDNIVPFTLHPNVRCNLVWRMSGAKACLWNQRDYGVGGGPNLVRRIAIRLTSAIVSNSYAGAEYLSDSYHIPKESIQVIPNGVTVGSLPASAPTSRAGKGSGPFTYTMVANLTQEKDHFTLLRAWALFREHVRTVARPAPVQLILGGRLGPTSEACRELVTSLSLATTVKMVGEVSDVGHLLESTDVAVLSSRSEGCSNAILEAMAAGLPVVATDIPAIRDTVAQENLPFLFVPVAPVDCAAKLVLAYESPELRHAAGAANYHRAQQMYGATTMTAQVLRVLQESART